MDFVFTSPYNVHGWTNHVSCNAEMTHGSAGRNAKRETIATTDCHGNPMKYTRRSHGGTLSLRELELRMASSRDGVAASWFRNSEEGKCGKDSDFEFRLF
jgi:hypothetical protein